MNEKTKPGKIKNAFKEQNYFYLKLEIVSASLASGKSDISSIRFRLAWNSLINQSINQLKFTINLRSKTK